MADEANINKLVREYQLTLKVDSATAEKHVREMMATAKALGLEFRSATGSAKSFADSLLGIGKNAGQANTMLDKMRGIAGFLAGTATGLGNASKIVAAAFGGGALLRGSKELRELYKATLLSANQFKPYGNTIAEINKQVMSMGEAFGFTRTESMKLMNTVRDSFTFKPIEQMGNYMQFLEKAVGPNVDAMAAYAQTVGQVAQKMIGLQQAMEKVNETGSLSTKDVADMQKNAIRLAFSGKLSSQDFANALNISTVAQTGGGRNPQDRAEFDQSSRYLKLGNTIERFGNELEIGIGKKLTPAFETLAGIFEKDGMKIANVFSSIATYGAYASAALGSVGAISTGAQLIKGVGSVGKGIIGALTNKPGGAAATAGQVIGSRGGKLATVANELLRGGGAEGAIPVYVVNMPGSGKQGGLNRLSNKTPMEAEKELEKSLGWFGRARASLNKMFLEESPGVRGFIGRGGAAGKIGLGRVGQAGVGGAVGYVAGEAARYGLGKLTGTTAEEGGFTAGVGGVGGRLVGGLAVGGPVGAIAALSAGIVQDTVEIGKVSKDIAGIWIDIGNEQRRQANLFDEHIAKRKQEGDSVEYVNLLKSTKTVGEASDKVASRQQWYNPMGWFGGESRAKKELEDAQKAQAIAKKQALEKDPRYKSNQERIAAGKSLDAEAKKQKEVNNLTDRQKKELMLIKSQIDAMNQLLEQQKQTLAAREGLLEAQANVANMMASGPTKELSSASNDYLKQIDDTNNLLGVQISIMDQALDRAKALGFEQRGTLEQQQEAMKKLSEVSKIDDPGKREEAMQNFLMTAGAIAAVEQRRAELQTQQLNNIGALEKAQSKELSAFQRQNEMQEAGVQLLEAQISLADNLALGVAASAEMRMQAVRKISDVIYVNRQKQLVIEQQIAVAQKEQADNAEAAAAGDVDAQRKVQAGRQAEAAAQINYMRNQTGILQLQQKQAELVRTLRDGWISAISAMNTGVGMFTKIKIDRETRLGTLMSNAPKPVVGIQTGFAGPGRTESTRFSAQGVGVLTNPEKANESFGAGSPEWRRAMDKRSPLGFNAVPGGRITPEAAAGQVSLWQELKGQYQNTAMAGAVEAKFGESTLTEMAGSVTEGVSAGMKKVFSTTNPLPVQIIKGMGETVVPKTIEEAPRKGMKDGGIVQGGMPGRDSVPAMLMPGEGVLTKEAAKEIGHQNIINLNRGADILEITKNINLPEDMKPSTRAAYPEATAGSETVKEVHEDARPPTFVEGLSGYSRKMVKKITKTSVSKPLMLGPVGDVTEETLHKTEETVHPKGMKDGGIVQGGMPGKDSVSAMLMPGEGVLTKEAAKEIGHENIFDLNRGVRLPDIIKNTYVSLPNIPAPEEGSISQGIARDIDNADDEMLTSEAPMVQETSYSAPPSAPVRRGRSGRGGRKPDGSRPPSQKPSATKPPEQRPPRPMHPIQPPEHKPIQGTSRGGSSFAGPLNSYADQRSYVPNNVAPPPPVPYVPEDRSISDELAKRIRERQEYVPDELPEGFDVKKFSVEHNDEYMKSVVESEQDLSRQYISAQTLEKNLVRQLNVTVNKKDIASIVEKRVNNRKRMKEIVQEQTELVRAETEPKLTPILSKHIAQILDIKRASRSGTVKGDVGAGLKPQVTEPVSKPSVDKTPFQKVGITGIRDLSIAERASKEVESNVPKGFDIQRFFVEHNETYMKAVVESEQEVSKRYSDYQQVEKNLVDQLHRTSNKRTISTIAEKRTINRSRMKNLVREQSELVRAETEPLLTPTLARHLSIYARKLETAKGTQAGPRETKKLPGDKKAAVQSVPAQQTATDKDAYEKMTLTEQAEEDAKRITGGMPQVPEVKDKWWNDPDNRTDDGAPLAVSKPPTRQTSPELFSSLDASVSVPERVFIRTDGPVLISNLLSQIMSENDGIHRQIMLDDISIQMSEGQSTKIVDNQTKYKQKLESLKEQYALARGTVPVQPGKEQEMFLSKEETEKIRNKIEETKEQYTSESVQSVMLDRQKQFVANADMIMVERYIQAKGIKEKEAEKTAQQERGKVLEIKQLEYAHQFELTPFEKGQGWLLPNNGKYNPHDDRTWKFPGAPIFNEKNDVIGRYDSKLFPQPQPLSSIITASPPPSAVEQVLEIFENTHTDIGNVKRKWEDANSGLAIVNRLRKEQGFLPIDKEQNKAVTVGEIWEASKDVSIEATQGAIGIAKDVTEKIPDWFNELVGNSRIARKNETDTMPVASEIAKNSERIANIPKMAMGGIVHPTPGGSIVNVAEGGQPEAIAPLPALQSMISSNMQKVNAVSVRPMMDRVASSVDGVMGRQSQQVPVSPTSGSDLSNIKQAWVNEVISAMRGVMEAASARLIEDLNRGA